MAKKPTVPKGPRLGRASGQEIVALRQPSAVRKTKEDSKKSSVRNIAESSYVLARRLYSNKIRFGLGPMNFLFNVERKDKDRTTRLSLGHVLGRTKLKEIKESPEKKSPRTK